MELSTIKAGQNLIKNRCNEYSLQFINNNDKRIACNEFQYS
jgi:hypothetical protein